MSAVVFGGFCLFVASIGILIWFFHQWARQLQHGMKEMVHEFRWFREKINSKDGCQASKLPNENIVLRNRNSDDILSEHTQEVLYRRVPTPPCSKESHKDGVVCHVQAQNLNINKIQMQTQSDRGNIMKDAKVFVKTTGYVVAKQCLEQFKRLTIIGAPGSGKSAIGCQLLRDFQDKYDWCIANSHEKIEQHRKSSKRPSIYLINDIFGTTYFKPSVYQKWKDWLEHSMIYESNARSFYIFTSRNYIYLDALSIVGFLNSTVFEDNTIIDLSSDYNLTLAEKENFFTKHKQQSKKVVDDALKKKICNLESVYSFPYCCHVFFQLTGEVESPIDLFRNPPFFLIQTLKEFTFSDPKNYIAVMLVLLHKGHLDLASLSVNDVHLQEFLKKYKSVSGEDFVDGRWEIFSSLCGSFLSMERNVVTFNHATVYSAVAYLMGTRHPAFVIENCPLQFLYERVRLQGRQIHGVQTARDAYEDKQKLQILITNELPHLLANRFAKELAGNNFPLVCAHEAMSHLFFIKLCLENVSFLNRFSVYNLDSAFSESILYWSTWNKSHVLCDYLLHQFQFDENTILKAALSCCCDSGNIGTLKCLLEAIPNRQRLLSYASHPYDNLCAVSTSSTSLVTTRKQRSCTKDSLIHKACESGKFTVVELLLKYGFQLNTVNKDGDTLLHKSVMSENTKLTEFLIDSGCRIDQTNNTVDTPLHRAAHCGGIHHVTILLSASRGLNFETYKNSKNAHGDTPLVLASSMGHQRVLLLLLSENCNINLRNNSLLTALMVSSLNGHAGVVQKLIDHRAKADFVDENGNTAFMMACKGGYDKVMEVLHKSSDINIINNDGNSPLTLACSQSNVTIVKKLLEWKVNMVCYDKDGNSPLAIACRSGNDILVKLLLLYGASIHDKTEGEETPLTLAYSFGNEHIFGLLIESADLHIPADQRAKLFRLRNSRISRFVRIIFLEITVTNSVSRKSITEVIDQLIAYSTQEPIFTSILNWTCCLGYLVFTELLLSCDPDTDLENNDPLVIACIKGNTELIRLLLSYSMDVNALSSDGKTPLIESTKTNNAQVVQLLLSENANSNLSNVDGDTALTVSCTKGYGHILEILLKHGTSVNIQNKHGNTGLILACMNGHEHIVRMLPSYIVQRNNGILEDVGLIMSTENEIDVDHVNNDGHTALLVACVTGHTDTISLLSAYGADISVRSTKNWTALMLSSHYGHESVVHLLLNLGSDVDACDADGMTSLMVSCIAGSFNIAHILIENDAKVNIASKDGYTALMWACRLKDSKIAELLLSKGADVNVQGNDGFTPLHCACTSNQPATVELLIGSNADISMEDKHGWSCMLWCIATGRVEILNMILPHANVERELSVLFDNGDTPLMLACKAGYVDVIEMLIGYEIGINTYNNCNETPLMVACRNSSAEICFLLLSYGSEAKVKNGNGDTLLHLACTAGSFAIAESLICYVGQKHVNAKNNDGNTALHLAASGDFKDIVDILLCCEADLTLQNNWGKTARNIAMSHHSTERLIYEAKEINTEILKVSTTGPVAELKTLMMRRYANVNTRNSNGETPLLVASRCANSEIVNFLLFNNALVNVKDNNGDSALSLAVTTDNCHIIRSLISHGADINCRNLDGDTALNIACRCGCKNAINLLLATGADVNLRNNKGYNAWAAAEEEDNDHDLAVNIYKLTEESKHEATLIKTVRRENERHLKILIAGGADVNKSDANQETALMVASREGNVAATELLILSEALLNIRNILGDTALIIACKRGHKKIVKGLISASAIPNIGNRRGNTALHMACKFGHSKIVKFLLKHNIWIEVANKAGETPFLMACKHGNEQVVHVMLKKQVNVEAADNTGNRPLHWACIRGYSEIVGFLLKRKINPDFLNRSRTTAMMFACEGGFVHIVQQLLAAKACTFMRNENGDDCLDIARNKGHRNVTKLLGWETPYGETDEDMYDTIDEDDLYDDCMNIATDENVYDTADESKVYDDFQVTYTYR